MNNPGAGDKLARGMSKAVFPAMGENVSQEKWDQMWATDETPAPTAGTESEEKKEEVKESEPEKS